MPDVAERSNAVAQTKCDISVRVRVFALRPDGAPSLDPLATDEDACDLEVGHIMALAKARAEECTEGIDPHPKRCRVEVSLARERKGQPKALHRDCIWAKRGEAAESLAKACAIRMRAAPPPAPPLTKQIDAIIDGALGAMDSAEQIRDGVALVQALSASTDPGAINPDKLFEMVGPLLQDPRVLKLLESVKKG